MYLFYQFSSFCQPTLVQDSEKCPKNESFEKMCPPQAVRFDWFLMEYSVFSSRTQVFVRLSTHEGHYIFFRHLPQHFNAIFTQHSKLLLLAQNQEPCCIKKPPPSGGGLRASMIPLPLRCRRCAVRPAASAWSPDGRSRPGSPVIQSCSAGKALLRKPGSAGIYAPNGAARTCARGHARRILRYSSSFAVQTMCSSSSCFCVTSEGAPMRISCAFLFIGNGIISRMDSSPASSMTMRSTPGAMPA